MRRRVTPLLMVLLVAPVFIALGCHITLRTGAESTGAAPAANPTVLFGDAAAESGLAFTHFAGATRTHYFPEIMGSGVALLDYNQDGALDVLVLQGDLVDPRAKPQNVLSLRPAGKRGCRLFRNDLARTGTLHFTDVTDRAGLGALNIGYAMGAAVGDYDNDGFPDIYITGYGHSVLLHNSGHGTFSDVTAQAGVGNDNAWATSAAFVDYDRDGMLDLVVANYVGFTVANNVPCVSQSGAPDYCGPASYRGTAPRLYHNLGGGKFRDVTAASGIGAMRAPGLGVSCADLDGDGWPDILFANDQKANTLWLNQRNGRFKEAATSAGCAFNTTGRSLANMGIAVGDVDNVGHEDVLITHLVNEGVTLFRSDGHGNFSDGTAQADLLNPTTPFTGFGADWFDYDNDGRLDLFIANGAVTADDRQRGESWPFLQTNQLFHNEGPGRPFVETTSAAGPALQLRGAGRGVALGDLNNDGRIDVVVTNNNGPARVLLNQVHNANHWLEVRLVGVKSNRMAIGAYVTVNRKGGDIRRRCHTDGSYCSAGDSRVHFGLGADPQIDAVTVVWPSGGRETWASVKANHIETLREGTGRAE